MPKTFKTKWYPAIPSLTLDMQNKRTDSVQVYRRMERLLRPICDRNVLFPIRAKFPVSLNQFEFTAINLQQ
jgi:hypothetical protein